MSEFDELQERDEAMHRITQLISDLEAEVREWVVESADPKLRIDLRRIMLELADVRASARRCYSWWAEPGRLRPPS